MIRHQGMWEARQKRVRGTQAGWPHHKPGSAGCAVPTQLQCHLSCMHSLRLHSFLHLVQLPLPTIMMALRAACVRAAIQLTLPPAGELVLCSVAGETEMGVASSLPPLPQMMLSTSISARPKPMMPAPMPATASGRRRTKGTMSLLTAMAVAFVVAVPFVVALLCAETS